MAYPTQSLSTSDFNNLVAASTRSAPLVPGSNTSTGFLVYLTRSLPNMTVTVAGTNSIGSSSIFPVDLRVPPAFGCPVPNIGFGVDRAAWITGSRLNLWTSGTATVTRSWLENDWLLGIGRTDTCYNTMSDGRVAYFVNWPTTGTLFVSDVGFTTATHLVDCPVSLTRSDFFAWVRLDDGRMMRLGSYLGGIGAGDTTQKSCDIIDPHGTGSVTYGSAMRYRRMWGDGPYPSIPASNVVALPGGRVMVIGALGLTGSGAFSFSNNTYTRLSGCEIWSSGTWTEVASLPFRSVGAHCAYIGNDKVILYGGYTGSNVYGYGDEMWDTYVYDIVGNNWTYQSQAADTATFRYPGGYPANFTVIASGTHAGKVYMFGGSDQKTMLLDTGTMQWSLGPSMSQYPQVSYHVTDDQGVIYSFGRNTPAVQYTDPSGDFTWYPITNVPLARLYAIPALISGNHIVCKSAWFSGSFLHGQTDPTGVTQLATDVSYYKYNRGIIGNTITFYGERLDAFNVSWDNLTQSIFAQTNDTFGQMATTNAPDAFAYAWATASWTGSIPIWASSTYGTQSLGSWNFAARASGSYDPSNYQEGGQSLWTEEYFTPEAYGWDNYFVSTRAEVVHSGTIIRAGGFNTPTASATPGTRYQIEYDNWVQRWQEEGMSPIRLGSLNTGCTRAGVISWGDNIVVIGGGTKRELFWSGTNSLTGATNFESAPMVHRNGVDDAGKFYNIQVGTMSGGPTASISWSNGVPLNVPRVDPTCIALTRGSKAGKILVAGGIGEAIFGYQLFPDASPNPVRTDIAISYPALRSVEIGDPTNGWITGSPMPETWFEQYPMKSPFFYSPGFYIRSGTEAEAVSGTNGVLPVTHSHGRFGMSAVELDDGRILFSGGDHLTVISSSFTSLLYDPDLDVWSEVSHSDIPNDTAVSFGYRPAMAKMLDGRVFVVSNPPSVYNPTYNTWIVDFAFTGSDRWLSIDTPYNMKYIHDPNGDGLGEQHIHVMENGNLAVVHAGVYNHIFDQCQLTFIPFSASLDKEYAMGRTAYVGSGTFFTVGLDRRNVGEGWEVFGYEARRIFQDLSASITSTILQSQINPYTGLQLVSSSQISASSVASLHETLVDPYGPGEANNTNWQSDWWKFIPASSSDYYFWARSGSDTNFPTGSNDTVNGFFDSRLWIWPWPSGTTPIFNDDANLPLGTQPDWNTLIPLTGGDLNYWSLAQASMTSGTTYYIEVTPFVAGDAFRYKLGVGAVGYAGVISGTLTHLAGNPP